MAGLRYIAAALAFLIGLWAAPAAAQGPAYFYCYAQDAATRTVYVSDVHSVGPVSERASYGAEFSRFLIASGKAPAGTQAYCTMHATQSEVERGVADLAQYCSGCTNPAGFEEVAWPRGGKTLANLLAGKLPARAPTAEPNGKAADPPAEEPAEGIGVFALGRTDQTDVVFTINEDNGQMLTRYKADLRGGKWTTILSNDRCPGWLAIAYASNASERAYFVSKGAGSEGEASLKALAAAEKFAHREGPDWNTGVLFAFVNDYRPSGPDLSNGVISAVKGELRKKVTTDCGQRDSASSGVRG